MFDFIRAHTRVLFFVLLLLIIPSFVLFGIDGYRRFDQEGNRTVAKVAGTSISQAEWDGVFRQEADRIRQQQPNVDPKELDNPERKLKVLEELVRQRVMVAAAEKLHLATPDERLKRLFATDPQFASVRNPDGSANKELLALQGMSTDMLAYRLRQDISAQQVFRGLGASVLVSGALVNHNLDALFQQREIQVVSFPAQKYLSTVKPTDAELDAYYKDPVNAVRFKAPEQVDMEYVVLDLEAMKKSVNVSEEDLKKYYEQNEKRFTIPEERRASHVLIKADKDTPAADRAKAKAKAEALLVELRAKPGSFADVARKQSQDPGSAERGGDLDFFGRGLMLKPFEDAAFALEKNGDLSGVVESDYGYHIIQLTGKRGGEKRSFESVRAEIEAEVKTQLAQKKFSEAAVDFSNLVYEQADSLKPAADKFKLDIQTANGVVRGFRGDAGNPLANPRLQELLFADDAVRNKRNTEAVDLGGSRLVSGRVIKHQPARSLPLDEVRDAVRQAVAVRQAAVMARKEGEAKLAELQKAPQTILTETARKVSRLQSAELPAVVVEAVLRAPANTLPSYVGVDLGDQGYAVVKLNQVQGRDAAMADPVRGASQYGQVWAEAEALAYYASLKKRFKVDIKAKSVAAPATAVN